MNLIFNIFVSLEPWDIFPENFNERITPEFLCYINIFIAYNDECRYNTTRTCFLKDLDTTINKTLENSNWSSINYEINYAVTASESVICTSRDLISIIRNGRTVMNIVVKPQMLSKKYFDS